MHHMVSFSEECFLLEKSYSQSYIRSGSNASSAQIIEADIPDEEEEARKCDCK